MKIVLLTLLLYVSTVNAAGISDFEAKVFGKKETFKLSEHLGKKKIVINFFASWCVPCKKEIPQLNELKSKYQDTLFIAVNAAEKHKKIKKFVKRNNFQYTVLEDPESKIAKLYNIDSLPVTIIISKDKKVVYRSELPPNKL